jgi:hypothetical protein
LRAASVRVSDILLPGGIGTALEVMLNALKNLGVVQA